MKKRLLTLVLALTLCLTLTAPVGAAKTAEVWNGTVASSFNGGTGTKDNPYQIATGAQLAYLAQLVNDGNNSYNAASYVLTADIDLGGIDRNGDGVAKNEWTPIGIGDDCYFYGSFDGGGHTISGLYIRHYDGDIGLFAVVFTGELKNTTVSGTITIASDEEFVSFDVGGLVGWGYQATIENCRSGVDIIGSYSALDTLLDFGGIIGGGIIGCNSEGVVRNCSNSGTLTVTGDTTAGTWITVGGIAGFSSGTLEDCSNTGSVTGEGICNGVSTDGMHYDGSGLDYAGIVGNNGEGSVKNCSNFGNITFSGSGSYGEYDIGGIVGRNSGNIEKSVVENCDNMGDVAVTSAGICVYTIGGITGWNDDALDNCKNSGDISCQRMSGSGIYNSISIGGISGNNYGTVRNSSNIGKVTAIINDTFTLSDCGGIVGYNSAAGYFSEGTIETCDNSGDVVGHRLTGGIVGENNEGAVERCQNTGNITGNNHIGGVAARNNAGKIEGSSNSGVITDSGSTISSYIGGVASMNENGGQIWNCYNAGNLTSEKAERGSVGGVVYSNWGQIGHCYNTGNVTGYFADGIVVAAGYEATVEDCYNTGIISDHSTQTASKTDESETTSPVVTTDMTAHIPDDFVNVTVNGAAVVWTDAEPYIDANNRTMVPLRAVGNALGLSVDWDDATKTASFSDGHKTIYFPVGGTTAYTTDGTVTMDTAAVIVNDRTYAPVRYLAEFFGHDVGWADETRTVIIQ